MNKSQKIPFALNSLIFSAVMSFSPSSFAAEGAFNVTCGSQTFTVNKLSDLDIKELSTPCVIEAGSQMVQVKCHGSPGIYTSHTGGVDGNGAKRVSYPPDRARITIAEKSKVQSKDRLLIYRDNAETIFVADLYYNTQFHKQEVIYIAYDSPASCEILPFSWGPHVGGC